MSTTSPDNISLSNAKEYVKSMIIFYNYIRVFILSAIARYKILIIVIAGAGLIAGFAIAKSQGGYYQGSATITYITLNKKLYGEMLDKLNDLVHSNSYKALSAELKMPEADCAKILDLEGLNVAGSKLSEDITEVRQPFYVKVKLSDRNIAPILLASLKNYLNGNPFGKDLVEKDILKIRRRILFLGSELRKIDSLKALPVYSVQPGVINELFKKSEDIFIEKSDLEVALSNYEGVIIMDKFVLADQPTTPSYPKIMLKYMLLALLLGIISSLFIHSIKRATV